MNAMPTIQMLLDLDFSLCEAIRAPLKRKAIKKVFGIKPVQFAFKFSFKPVKTSLIEKLKGAICKLIKKIKAWID